MEQALRAFLLSYSAITDLIGTRIYPDILPQDPTYPAITYQEISGPRDYTQQGADGVTTYRVQLDLWANTFEEVIPLRDAVEASVSGVHHVEHGSPAMIIHGAFIDDSRSGFASALDDTSTAPYRKGFDLRITVSSA